MYYYNNQSILYKIDLFIIGKINYFKNCRSDMNTIVTFYKDRF